MPLFDYPRRQIHPVQLDTLKMWCHIYKPKVIVEVGSWLGQSTSIFGQYADSVGGIVIAVDWWQDNPDVGLLNDKIDVFHQFKENMKELGLERVVIPFPMTSKMASRFVVDNSVDMLFIDADHKYSSVADDINRWYPKVKPGGIICGHDFEAYEYDERYIEQDVHDHRHHGVIKAVTEAFPNVRQEERMWIQAL